MKQVQTVKKLAGTRNLALSAVLGATYVAIGLVTPSISFGPVQCRVADALYPLIALFGYPAALGLTLGQFIYNLYGYGVGVALGPLDLLSPLVFLVPKLLIARYGIRAVPIHIVAVGLWVPYLLQTVFGAPMTVTIPLVMAGEAIAEGILGTGVYLAINRITTTQSLQNPRDE